MLSYIARRLVHMIPVLIGASVLSFATMHLMPGNAIQIMVGLHPSEAVVEAARKELGLDQPLLVQYGRFLSDAVRGDFGKSFIQKVPVSQLIGEAIGATGFLIAYSIVLTILLTLPLAMISAMRESRLADHLIRVVTMIGFAMPSFWVGLLLMLMLGLHLDLFPISGFGEGFTGHLRHMFLPALTITFFLTPVLVQSLRAALLEVMTADYIEVAQAKGLSPRRVMVKHVLRNALIPVVTILAINVGWLISGAVIVEYVFSLHGLGSVLVRAVSLRDYPLVQGLTIVFAVIVMMVNLSADIAYTVIDKRVTRK